MKNSRRLVAVSLFVAVAINYAAAADVDAAKRVGKLKDTLKYGTETEIVETLKAIDGDDKDSIDSELGDLFGITRNERIQQAILGFCVANKKAVLGPAALDKLKTWDQINAKTVDSLLAYEAAIKNREALQALKDMLDAGDENFAIGGVRTYGQCGISEDAAYLLAYLDKNESNEKLVPEILFALGELKSKDAEARLKGIVEDKDRKAIQRMYAVEALGKLKDDASLPTLIGAAEDADPNLRLYVYNALKNFPAGSTTKVYLDGLRDTFYKARIACAEALGTANAAEAIPFLSFRIERDDVPAVREAAARALSKIKNTDALDYLKKRLEDDKTPDRFRAAIAAALMENAPDEGADLAVKVYRDAKGKKNVFLAGALIKALSSAKSPKLEAIASELLTSAELGDRLSGLDLTMANSFKALAPTVKALQLDKAGSVAAKAKKVLEALGGE